MRHRILLQTDPTWLKTGLSENSKTLLRYLWKTGKYDIAHMATQATSVLDPRLQMTPWKSYGSIPNDPALVQQLNSDPNLQRNASYGAYNIDNVVREYQPTIWIGSNDAWSFQLGDYCEKPWYKQINTVHHITVDSVPVLDLAFEQARRSKHYVTWAQFAVKEMNRVRPDGSMKHVTSIYGAMDTTAFSPISDAEKAAIRAQFGIDQDILIFLFVSRNQLRKSFVRVLEGYARFRREHPTIKAALHFHTSFSEKANGWDIPKMAAFYGINPREILATYACRQCGRWWVAPYGGEDVNCPHCGAEKSAITVNIQTGVPAHEMRFVYGLADACVSAYTSGGQEYHNVQSLLCGKPLACTNYSCGEDFITPETMPFIYPLRHSVTEEMGTNFLKAATDPVSIAAFMRQVSKASKKELAAVGEKGRAWATKTFSIEAIGAQWERLFDSMPITDWSTVTLTSSASKNEGYPMPGADTSDLDFITLMYRHILSMDEKADSEGTKHWLAKLQAGLSRADIYRYFIGVAKQENAKNQPPQDFGTLLDDRPGRKRGLFVIKESIGDVAICTSLFEGFHQQHPNTDLYVATLPQYADVLIGNQHVHKVLPYIPQMENELAMIGQGKVNAYFSVYYHPAITTQRVLQYLSHPEPAFDVTADDGNERVMRFARSCGKIARAVNHLKDHPIS